MNDAAQYHHLLNYATTGKHEFLDWLEFLDVHEEDEHLYDLIIGWPNEKFLGFIQHFEFDLDRLDEQIYEWDDEYIMQTA